ncbi:phosphatidylglycerol lysyltransferase domain-containing protein [Thauera sp. Sel9]|uniref:phosphatidylglycerol lysyltransferase domain-containing protein n=1 Tax=Thauera sp. Sel9 TaxID=2974299 RepID=UPI0021E187B1|nr:phosphatidylglycerol lysyltransferase domain-containing protein [Thauera sp. Sel9]MCV2219140.1 phosphatidylglycerol lysyltransferase domain-containing protein [Thauera sp. Sel9]
MAEGAAAAPVVAEALCPSQADWVEARLRPLRVAQGAGCPAEYSFSNLYLFRAAHDYRLIRDAALPCIVGRTYDGEAHVLPLFDVAGADPGHLAALVARHGALYPLAGHTVAGLDAARFTARAVREDADYLYRAAELRALAGPRLRKKRAQIRQLLGAHRLRCCPLGAAADDTLDAAATACDDALRVLDGWIAEKGKAAGEADQPACAAALRAPWLAAHAGWLWYADDQPAGFLLAQRLNAEVMVVRFAKGLAAYAGVFPLMFHALAQHTDAPWINFEQDLGVANFRRAKLAYAPAMLLAKYRVDLRPG